MLKVEAYDLGLPSNKAIKEIKVVLNDVNDFIPQFLLKAGGISKN